MRLDIATLLLVTFVLTFLVGVLFVLSWVQARRTHALAIWGVAHLVGAIASGGLALRGTIPDWLSIGVANAMMIAAYGLIWSGVRAFEGRSLRLSIAILSGGAFATACLVPAFYGSIAARVVLASSIATLFCAASAYEIWRGRAERLVSRYPAMILLCIYGLCYAVRIPAAFLAPLPTSPDALQSRWVAILCFAAMLFTIALAFTFMALTKERAERAQRLAASVDPLTGIANRRAFVLEAEAMLARPSPSALLLFDLDHFKRVNDTYGHAVGDGVLVGFCALGRALLPGDRAFGRLGGEEFACLIPAQTPEAARREAVRFGRAFAALRLPMLPHLEVSCSIGVAVSTPGHERFDDLMRRADLALYRAKRNGRSRTELAEADGPDVQAARNRRLPWPQAAE
ncbi:GGDEF domain-containing protein [Methylobacterium sp. E-016]|uniref:GGDEF domain-containing protein n=1 Tax=Methylobacterium sp. E-016 TaxID=2836556 RepID=UPI001FB8C573|nr:GGDEF domain-containing protein [Methylobacterium sp. E-016]MCJ2076901.1 GGDEF domain-containing protein [Methylobacterium sp. E-016]